MVTTRLVPPRGGKERKDNGVIAYHLRRSFKPEEITPEQASKIGYEHAMPLTKGNHAFIVCTQGRWFSFN